MVWALWVEELSPEKRTELLKHYVSTRGFKLRLSQFLKLISKDLSEAHIEFLNTVLRTKQFYIITQYPMIIDSPISIALGYGIIRVNNRLGFYWSLMRPYGDGIPEIRLIVETEKEFYWWLRGFIALFKRISIDLSCTKEILGKSDIAT